MSTPDVRPLSPEIPSTLSSLIQTRVPLADKNWFKTGGHARYYAAPKTAGEFQQALAYAREHNLPVFVLGCGANILISDHGFDGLVIQPHLEDISYSLVEAGTAIVHVGAGVQMDTLIEYCLQHNIIGLEEFSGIPGTVGGSVYINLHYFEFLLEQFLLKCQVIDKATGQIFTVDTDWFNFDYNQSTLQKHEHYLVAATFKLRKVSDLETAYAKGRRTEIMRHRYKRYPTSHTCGSFFRNFREDEVALTTATGKPLIFVAYYLDKIGVKGALKVGNASVSHQHANMLLNNGTATSDDLINLARTMQELVRKEFGVTPQPECILVGFKEYPLLK
ncbi:MAG TPA: UDP-N-acetylmuramate dehydrogenase [Candidatus Limnocylindria bacterium]|nr:UDP-N-acetylmuramate dehydrogenase [Candidatus Limnocylindria bacterium]